MAKKKEVKTEEVGQTINTSLDITQVAINEVNDLLKKEEQEVKPTPVAKSKELTTIQIQIDIDNDYEFQTSFGAVFKRLTGVHYSIFPNAKDFENQTSPFVSESYSIDDKTFSKLSVYVLYDNQGIWVYLETEKLERKIISEKIIKLIAVEKVLEFINSLKTELTLKEIENFKDYSKE